MPTSWICEASGAFPLRLAAPWHFFLPTASPNRHQATAEIWQETYLSAVLRAILYSDDPTYFLEAYRRLEPISTPDAELRFLQGAEALFMKGSNFSTYHTSITTDPRQLSWLKYRMASRIGSRDPGCDCCLESPHRWCSQVFW